MKLHHLGIACSDIQETLKQVQSLFPVTGCSEVIYDAEQDADACMVTIQDSPPLELISGPAVLGLVKRGITLYHTCWEVADLEAAILHMEQAGSKVISEPKPAILFGSRRVAFLMTSAGMIELLEIKRAR